MEYCLKRSDISNKKVSFFDFEHLRMARDHLTPIISQILTSSARGDSKYSLTLEQYEYAIWASQVLNEIDQESKIYPLPNTDFIINNAIEKKGKVSRAIMIDEATMVDLVELYHKMGIVIQKLSNKIFRNNDKEEIHTVSDKSDNEIIDHIFSSDTEDQILSKTNFAASDQKPKASSNETENVANFWKTNNADILDLFNDEDQNITKSNDLDVKYNNSTSSIKQIEEIITAKKILPDFSDNSNKNKTIDNFDEANLNLCGDEGRIFIKIQCLNDLSDSDYDKTIANSIPLDDLPLCNSCCHLRLGENHFALKVSQSLEENTIYCLNTKESQHNELKIIIIQCPECAAANTNRQLKDSHESMILHGKDGNESVMDDSDQKKLCTCRIEQQICENRCDQNISPCVCTKTIQEFVQDADIEPAVLSPKMSNESAASLKKTLTKKPTDSSPKMSKTSTTSFDKTLNKKSTSSKLLTSSLSDVQVLPEPVDLPPDARSISQQVYSKSDHFSSRSIQQKSKESFKVLQKSSLDVLVDPEESFKVSEKSGLDVLVAPEESFRVSEKSGLDVLLDPNNVDKSTIIVHPESKAKSPMPLTRRRVCSSMEFDVSTAPTRLRDHEIEHKNSKIMSELKNLKVDEILRASRPAKCCRKAILNEKQKVALPYCASLRSLPLVENDIEVIKQSIDMSLRKIKNSLDLTENNQDKLAYYVSLGQDDFKPNINFPWVIPIYNLQIRKQKAKHKFFVLKKRLSKDDLGFSDQVIGDGTRNKWYFLTKADSFRKLQNISVKTKVRVEINKECTFVEKQKFRKSSKILKRKYYTLIENCSHQTARDIGSVSNLFQNFKNEESKEKCLSSFMDAGDSSISSIRCLLDLYFDKLQNCNPKSMTSASWTQYEPSAMTVLVKKEPNLEKLKTPKTFTKEELERFRKPLLSEMKLKNNWKMLQTPQISFDRYILKNSLQKKTKRKNKLEYYVGLIDGNLVWNESLPLKPINYKTYYGYVKSSRSSIQAKQENKPKPQKRKIENQQKIEPRNKFESLDQDASKFKPSNKHTTKTAVQVFSKQRNISELTFQHVVPLHRMPSPKTKKSKDASKLTRNKPSNKHATKTAVQVFSKQRNISELTFQHVVPLHRMPSPKTKKSKQNKSSNSQHFLNKNVKLEKSTQTPTCTKFNESDKLNTILSLTSGVSTESWIPFLASERSLPAVIEDTVIQKTPESSPKSCRKTADTCKKQIWIEKKCADCSTSACSGIQKKHHSRNITIDIRNVKNKGAVVQHTGRTGFKELCEIYRNKKFSLKEETICDRTTKTGEDQEIQIPANKNIEIFVNNRRIRIDNLRCKMKKN